MSDLDFSNLSPSELQNALERPALEPPEGIEPNFLAPGNQNAVALAGLLVCLIVSSTVFLIRVYVRFVKLAEKEVADYLIVVGFGFYLVVVGGAIRRALTDPGFFAHQWDIHGRDIKDYLLRTFIGVEFWLGSILIIKAAILIEWLRIFAPIRCVNVYFHWTCRILLAVTIVFYISALLALSLNCFPFRRIYDKTVPGKCINLKSIHVAVAVINILLDVMILLLPQRIIWKLQTSTAVRLGVSAAFTVGLGACVAAGFLLAAIVAWIRSDDMTYNYSSVVLWGIAESTCGILVFCVPVTPKAFRDLDISKWASQHGSSATMLINRLRGSQKVTENEGWPQPSRGSHRPHDYHEITEPYPIPLQAMLSPRPTDQQYGIVCTTDVTVTETYGPLGAKNSDAYQYAWATSV